MSSKRKAYLAICLCLCLSAVWPTVRAQQTPATPPDQKAYREARSIRDPQKKIDALEKFLKDFTDSSSMLAARLDIVETLIKNFPDQKERIRAEAEKTLLVSDFSLTYNQIATKLLEAGVMLDYAEELGQRGVARFEEEMATNVGRLRANYQATLGNIYLKEGKTKEAEQAFKKANEYDSTNASAVVGLAAIAEKNGDRKAALDYFTSALVLGPMKEADRKKVETLYRQTHNDSLAELEEMLDAKYRQLNPLPFQVAPYKAAAARTNRTVLAELFTGSGCLPCVAADLGFDAMLERYSRQELAVLVYHLHIPLPDPMTNPSTQARAKFYSAANTPSYLFDGIKRVGGGFRAQTQNFYSANYPRVEERLILPAEAELKLSAALEGGQVKAKVTVDQIKGAAADLKLQIALAENELRFTGENGIRFHPMVVRSLGGKDALGFPVAAQGPTAVEWTFDLKAIESEIKRYLDDYEKEGHRGDEFTFSEKKYQLDPNNLSVVAFVQDEKSRNVLQTVYVKVKASAAASSQKAEK